MLHRPDPRWVVCKRHGLHTLQDTCVMNHEGVSQSINQSLPLPQRVPDLFMISCLVLHIFWGFNDLLIRQGYRSLSPIVTTYLVSYLPSAPLSLHLRDQTYLKLLEPQRVV
jgi:hypothetical protein